MVPKHMNSATGIIFCLKLEPHFNKISLLTIKDILLLIS
jgi:hypothetical protein